MSNEDSRSDDYRGDDRGGDSRGRGGRDSRDSGDSRGGFRRNRPYFRKKVCRFCTQGLQVSFRNPDSLRRFVTERGKILPRRITGNCAKHQRALALEVKRARIIALLPFTKK
jgi:small subunit ribosomal protein S18